MWWLCVLCSEVFAVRDPRLVSVTVLFIACKVEEWQMNAKALLKEVHRAEAAAASAAPPVPYSVSDVLSMELDVLSSLGFDVIVYHPYRPLLHFLQPFASHASYPALLQHSWWLVNDSYHTDIPLLYPPYLIACACIYTACHLLALDHRQALLRLHLSTQAILDIAQQLLALHSRREQQRGQPSTAQPPLSSATHDPQPPIAPSVEASLTILRAHFDAKRRPEEEGNEGANARLGQETRRERERERMATSGATGEEDEKRRGAGESTVSSSAAMRMEEVQVLHDGDGGQQSRGAEEADDAAAESTARRKKRRVADASGAAASL